MRLLVLAPLMMAATYAPPALALEQVRSVWTIEPKDVPPGDLVLRSKQFVIKQRLIPAGLAELTEAFNSSNGHDMLPAHTQLVNFSTPQVRLFCGVPWCFVDQNNDGTFTAGFRIGRADLVSMSGRPSKFTSLAPVRYQVVDPKTIKQEYFVAIEWRNYFNIYGKTNFVIAFGTPEFPQEISAPTSIASGDYPKEVSILGAHFTVLGQNKGSVTVRVKSTMPEQPFGVTISGVGAR